jgi:hypothetical protein
LPGDGLKRPVVEQLQQIAKLVIDMHTTLALKFAHKVKCGKKDLMNKYGDPPHLSVIFS